MSSAPRLKLSPRGWSDDPSSYSLVHSLSLCWLLVRHRCCGDVMMDKLGMAILIVVGCGTSLAALGWFTILPAIGVLYLVGYLN